MKFIAPKRPPRKYSALTPGARKVLHYYKTVAYEVLGNHFRRSLPTIAAATGLSRRAVWNANDCLRQLGFLDWNRGHGNVGVGLPNEYWLDLDKLGIPNQPAGGG